MADPTPGTGAPLSKMDAAEILRRYAPVGTTLPVCLERARAATADHPVRSHQIERAALALGLVEVPR